MSRPLGAPAKTSRRQLAATAPGLLGRCAAGRAVKLDRHPVEPSDGRGQTAVRTGLPGDSFARHVSPGRHVNTGEGVPCDPGFEPERTPLNGTALPAREARQPGLRGRDGSERRQLATTTATNWSAFDRG